MGTFEWAPKPEARSDEFIVATYTCCHCGAVIRGLAKGPKLCRSCLGKRAYLRQLRKNKPMLSTKCLAKLKELEAYFKGTVV